MQHVCVCVYMCVCVCVCVCLQGRGGFAVVSNLMCELPLAVVDELFEMNSNSTVRND